VLDRVITGGVVVDGTGAPGRRADVGIKDGRIVAVGELDEGAAEVIDATDLVVAPGFIDVHTHYDAQAFWDPTLSPSPLHGVTTVFAGNCGFTIAPLGTDPADGDYLMRMLARVEGMPLESLQQGVPWDWNTTAEYLDRLDGTLVPNAGFMVGHSALRRVVMHDAATERHATPEELAAMCALLRDGLRAGALGFSSTWAPTHSDHRGVPVPSRAASREEILALCAVVGEFPGTGLEFIPAIGQFDDHDRELMAAMSAAANRPLNWNVLVVMGRKNLEAQEGQLAASDVAAAKGGRIAALTLPDSARNRFTFITGFVLDIIPGFAAFFAKPIEERLRILADPEERRALNELGQTGGGVARSIAHWGAYRLETVHPDTQRFDGMLVSEAAEVMGLSAWDALCEILLIDQLQTGLHQPERGQDDESWERRVELWRDPRTLVGASDAGAHLDMIDSFNFATSMLAKAVRQRGLLPLEEAVQLITQRPARWYGVVDRGVVAEGMHADLVVLDPERVGPAPLERRHDLPGGAMRIYGGAEGIEHVLVNGSPVVRGKEFLEARPGRVLRSGTDTRDTDLA
jgi:N-acyl-D-aspartate/D-glutamate deacylase